MKRVKLLSFSLVLVFIASCASYHDPAKGFNGPLVVVEDSYQRISQIKGNLFYIERVDGKEIENIRHVTRAYGGYLSAVMFRPYSRKLPVRKMTVNLVANSTTLYEEGSRLQNEVEFEPEAGHIYMVKGLIKGYNFSVWIEDNNGKRVTDIVKGKIEG